MLESPLREPENHLPSSLLIIYVFETVGIPMYSGPPDEGLDICFFVFVTSYLIDSPDRKGLFGSWSQ